MEWGDSSVGIGFYPSKTGESSASAYQHPFSQTDQTDSISNATNVFIGHDAGTLGYFVYKVDGTSIQQPPGM